MKEVMNVMSGHDGIAGDSPEIPEDMIFSLDPLEMERADDPMWSTESSSPSDWFYAEE